MVRFGKYYVDSPGLSFVGKLGYYVYGHPHLGKFMQSYYFKKNIKKIMSRRIKNVLDVGCGNGEYSLYMAEKYPLISIDAIDNNKESILQGKTLQKKTNSDNIRFLETDVDNFVPVKKYDFIYCQECLHAIYDKNLLLRKIESWLVPRGVLYIQDSIRDGYNKMILRREPKQYRSYQKNYWRGKQYSLSDFEEVLSSLKLSIIDKKLIIGFFGQLSWEVDQLLHDLRMYRLRAFMLIPLKFLCLLEFILPIGKKNEVYIVVKK